MGQQQLLLIVLGVIIVGIAVVVGINVFTASSAQANQDAVIADMTTLASMAQQYYRKPVALGGGGKTFDGSSDATNGVAWSIPANLATTPNGQYSATVAAQTVTITGYGNSEVETGKYPKVEMTVTPSNITTDIKEPSALPTAEE